MLLAVWYLFIVAVVAFIIYSLWRRKQVWQAGRPIDRSDRRGERWRAVLQATFSQPRNRRRAGRGAAHITLSYGFVFLALSMIVIIVQENFTLPIFTATFNRYFHLAIDVAAIAVLIALAVFAGRRYLERPAGLDFRFDDAAILVGILLVVGSGIAIEGAHYALMRSALGWEGTAGIDVLRPAALAASELYRPLGLDAGYAQLIEPLRWLHGFLGFAFFALVGVTKLSHVFFGPLNVFHRNLEPAGALPAIDFENGPMGIARLTDLTWKDRLDLDACVRCGRCQEACPAYFTGKPLSPKSVIQTLKYHMDNGSDDVDLAGNVIAADTLWSCVTCMACMDACPLHIEHVPKIVGLRRQLVMEQNAIPEAAQAALHNLELRGHPWSGSTLNRTDWMESLDVPLMAEKPEAEWLFWVGCAGALVERNVESTKALAKVLKAGGVSFAVLGDEEMCNGDAARRLGAEHLFQLFAEQNIETFNRYGVKKVLTQCAHCYNTFKNEYTKMGLDIEVKHHTEFIAEMIETGKIAPSTPIDLTVTLHDSCYLGRYNGVFDAPRQALDALPGVQRVEMPRRLNESFCCGSGGGHAWLGDKIGKKINYERTEEAAATGAQAIAAGCLFCIQMFEDGIKGTGNEEMMRVFDVSELVAQSLKAPAPNDESGDLTDSVKA